MSVYMPTKYSNLTPSYKNSEMATWPTSELNRMFVRARFSIPPLSFPHLALKVVSSRGTPPRRLRYLLEIFDLAVSTSYGWVERVSGTRDIARTQE